MDFDNITDEKLVEQIQLGNKKAFASLVTKNSNKYYSL